MPSRWRGRIVGVAIIAAVVGGAVYLVRHPETPAPIQGTVRATELRIAPEVSGHLATMRVRKGAHVKAGDVVAELSALELIASVEQARAAYQSALADRNNVYAGVRNEEVAASAAEVAKAKSRLEYAEQQLARFARLTRDNFASRQALDQAQMQVATARADVAEAAANYASAKAGPTRQERAIADARVSAAAAEVAVLESRLRKTILTAPVDGIVQVIAGEVGEAIRAGQTIVTIEATAQPWLSFNVREDRLAGITVGSAVDVRIAGSSAATPASVTEVAALGQFATWQAERAVGDHDRNTVRLRVEPQGDLSKLEPGMTVWLAR
jgi:HlyD family secretion protein